MNLLRRLFAEPSLPEQVRQAKARYVRWLGFRVDKDGMPVGRISPWQYQHMVEQLRRNTPVIWEKPPTEKEFTPLVAVLDDYDRRLGTNRLSYPAYQALLDHLLTGRIITLN